MNEKGNFSNSLKNLKGQIYFTQLIVVFFYKVPQIDSCNN
jgi:hypothetical protein